MDRSTLSYSTIAILCLIIHACDPLPSAIFIQALPLSTNGRWIVNNYGTRVKLACVNLPSYLEPAVVEGLSKQPMEAIAQRILSLGFNCVRLNWPLLLFTNETLAKTTVRRSFVNLGLHDAVSGTFKNNPSLIDLPLIEAFKSVVSKLGDKKLMVILDNHVYKPGRCCSTEDGFNSDQWILGLTRAASTFKSMSMVVGMNLRNELTGGPRPSLNDWYRQMQRAAEAVHKESPTLLVMLSGLDFDKDLTFLRSQQLNLSFRGQTVFEMQLYAQTEGQAWATGNPNQVCGRVSDRVVKTLDVLSSRGWPLFVSQFGVDLGRTILNDNLFLSCFMGLAAGLDLDWALWTLAGSYYFTRGASGVDEPYGVLARDWHAARNVTFLKRLSAIQSPFRGPGIRETSLHLLIFHPATGLCVRRTSLFDPLKLDTCHLADPWTYATNQMTLTASGTYFCLQAEVLGGPAKLGLSCTGRNSTWSMISDSKMQLAATTPNMGTGCLDVDSNYTIIVNTCRCLDSSRSCHPDFQWFRLVNSTRS